MAFVSIQHSHGISAQGYQANSIRTGYENAIIGRTTDMFGQVAKDKGKVLNITDKALVIQYSDGSKESFEIGRRYGSAGALTYPHDLVSDLKNGSEFKKGDILFYNKNFFDKDYLNPKGVIYKHGALAKVALMERDITHEDSSAITRKLSDKLTTEVIRIVPITLTFNNTIHQLVKIGDEVQIGDPLCILEEKVSSDAGLFDAETLEALSKLSSDVKRAKFAGRIDNIELFYNGDIEDMSPSVLAIVNQYNAKLANFYRSLGEPVLNAEVDEGMRVNGDPIVEGTLVIRLYISASVAMANGDKLVFGNQLKSIVGKVYEEPILTESGIEVEALFGSISVGNRIVHSPYIIGMGNVLTKIAGDRVVNAYRNKV